ncbi:MAG: GNAT family N-acetyltransferase [Christensenellales bacterium]
MKIKNNYNGKEVITDLDFLFHEDYDYYEIIAKNSENNDIMGYLTFKVIKDSNIWIYKLETKQEYQGKGVGTALMNALEYFACSHNIDYIEGKFYPSNAVAKPFYEELGYIIDYDDYSQCVFKHLRVKDVLSRLEPNVIDFEIIDFEKVGQEIERER